MIHGFAADGGDVEDDDLDHLELAAEIVELTLERGEFWRKRARREAALRNARLLHTRVLQETPSTPGKVDDAPPTVGAGSVDEEEAPGVGGVEVGVGNGLGDVAVYGSDHGDAATLAAPREKTSIVVSDGDDDDIGRTVERDAWDPLDPSKKVRVVVREPPRMPVVAAAAADNVVHIPRCSRCRKRGTVCEGAPGQSCKVCRAAKVRCQFATSAGRGTGRVKVVETKARAPIVTAGPPVRPKRIRAAATPKKREVVVAESTGDDDDDDEDDDEDDDDNDNNDDNVRRRGNKKMVVVVPAQKRQRVENKGRVGQRLVGGSERTEVLLTLGEVHERLTALSVAVDALARRVQASE